MRRSGDYIVPTAVSYSQLRFVLTPADNSASFSVAACGTLPLCVNWKPLALQSLQQGVIPQGRGAEQLRKDHISREAHMKSVGAYVLPREAVF